MRRKYCLNHNQLRIGDHLHTNRLRTLERRALKRLRYFTQKRDKLEKIAEKDGDLISARDKVRFWENRLEQIHKILTERYLLKNDTESN